MTFALERQHRLPTDRKPDWTARPAERLPRVFATRDDAWECYERMPDEKKDRAWHRVVEVAAGNANRPAEAERYAFD